MPIAGERTRAAAAVTVFACIAVMSVVASQLYRQRRQRLRQQKDEKPDAGQLRPRRRCSEFDEKPQNRFKRVLADNSYSPFKHFKREGREKEISLQMHPFSTEITSLLEHPPSDITFIKEHRCPAMSSSFVWIDTTSKLEDLASQLSKQSVFAVDTEQHSLRSFLGFSALMQISIHEEDYLIDTIALHDSMLILRAVFANPSICKVFHGADNDILWLQRDFHIYVVNMFDTAKACEILSKPQKSLAYLLETYCEVSTDKTLQREDWRIRPLSAGMIQYARTDAHYLLYIADCLMLELQSMTLASSDDNLNFFFEASRRSNMVCLQLYAKEVDPIPGASAAASILSRNLNIEGLSSACSGTKDRIWILCAWRDLMARIHDESLRYVLSDQAIVALALKAPKISTEVYDAILQADLSNGSSSMYVNLQSPSPLINNHLDELCYLLQDSNSDIDEVFRTFLQKHIDPMGCSPLSAYNYALLSEFSLKQTSSSFLKQSVERCTKMVGKISSRELFVQKFSCKGPVYHNCRIYASDGRLLCYCDRKKLEWYIRRDLAKLVEDDPPAIMLLFEPKGRPEDEDNGFYIQSKKNMCVGCGEKNHYLRYRIIPSCYRMHFPEHLKSHRSHDIVLLCVDCHEVAHSAAERYKRKISKEYGIPLFVQKIVNSGESTVATVETVEGAETGVSPLQLRTAAMALLRHGSDMPEKRIEELMQIVKDYFGRTEISREDLEAALLVGMSPQERRRLEKKRGLSFRPNEQNIIYKNGSVNVVELVETNKEDNGAGYLVQEPSEDDLRKIVSPQGGLSRGDATAELSTDKSGSAACRRHVEQRKIYLIKPSEDENSSNSICDDDLALSSHKVISYRTAKKTSLLGHGPHGKQVVEHLLGKHGEDGIHQFCQRWRQVFVDAINPRFLPSGWDVLHSGRREFGDHSVYNPARKTS